MIAAEPDLTNWHALMDVLHRWHWARKPLASTINILSVALYDLFGADGACGLASAITLTLLFLRAGTQTITLLFCVPGASSTSSAAANASEVQSHCSRGESPFNPPPLEIAVVHDDGNDDFLRMSSKFPVSPQIPSCSSTISSPWRYIRFGFSSHIHGTSAFPGARNPSSRSPRWQSTPPYASLPCGP
jgi:hypothetical protein